MGAQEGILECWGRSGRPAPCSTEGEAGGAALTGGVGPQNSWCLCRLVLKAAPRKDWDSWGHRAVTVPRSSSENLCHFPEELPDFSEPQVLV